MCLTQDSQSLISPTGFVGAADNPDFSTRLRCVLYASPCDQDLSLPAPVFVSPVAVNYSPLLRQAAGVGFEEVVDNSSRQIQQFKLLSRQNCFHLFRVNQTVRDDPTKVSAGANITNCVVELLDSVFCIVALPEFPFLVEQF